MPTSFVEEGSQRVPTSKTDANLPATVERLEQRVMLLHLQQQ